MESTTRRSFYSAAIAGLGAIDDGGTRGSGRRLPSVPAQAPRNNRDFVPAADLTQLTIGKPEEVVFHRTRVDGWRVLNEKSTAWVVRKDDQNVVAFTPQCTHLACAYHWEEKDTKFFCPCHNSVFAIDGKVVSGPAPRPLDRYVTKIDQGKVLISSEIQKA